MKGSIRGTGMSNIMLYDALLSTLSYEAECYERQCLGMRKSDREVFSKRCSVLVDSADISSLFISLTHIKTFFMA